MSTLENLRKLREKLARPGAWTQGVHARNEEGRVVDPWDPRACSFCLRGGILSLGVDADEFSAMHAKIHKELPDPEDTLVSFNDREWRTQSDVVTLLDRVIAGLERQEVQS